MSSAQTHNFSWKQEGVCPGEIIAEVTKANEIIKDELLERKAEWYRWLDK